MAAGGDEFHEQFVLFSKFGDSKSEGKTITLTQADKWMKQANVIDMKHITTTDTGICFNKFKSKTVNYETFLKYLEELSKDKKANLVDMKAKMAECGPPGTKGTTQTSKSGAVDRLTDTAGYTGTHKERFDASGHGKGIEGREDVVANDGYVGNYKDKGTYDKTH